jgi:hypothetical protein
MLLAELAICRPLRDPQGELARLKALVAIYPEGLRARLIQDFLWHAQFTLFHARKHARRGDVYNTTGCLTRAAHALVQALAAEARHWQIGDKRALLAIAPAEAREIEAILGRPADDLEGCVERLVALHARVCARVGEAYRPPFDLV